MNPSSSFSKTIPRFIAVEGPIGVGKTSLAKRLGDTFNYDLLLEKAEENPFLERFYQNPRQHALSTQLFFLFQRSQQIQELRQDDLFEPVRVADFLIDKDQLFAQQNLDKDEYELYLKVFDHLTIDAPKPDLVIELEYLENLNRAYTEFFHYYSRTPLLIVNSAEIDLVRNEDDYNQLVDYISSAQNGTQYFNPRPSLL
jgi:deoxyguanosine kinase